MRSELDTNLGVKETSLLPSIVADSMEEKLMQSQKNHIIMDSANIRIFCGVSISLSFHLLFRTSRRFTRFIDASKLLFPLLIIYGLMMLWITGTYTTYSINRVGTGWETGRRRFVEADRYWGTPWFIV
jgi:hypothetical protein